jgi:hypothetical protein
MDTDLQHHRQNRRHLHPRGRSIPAYRIYGIDLDCETDFGLPLPESPGAPRVRFEMRGEAPVDLDRPEDGRARPAASSASTVDGRVAFTFAALDDCDVVRVTGVGDYFLYDDLVVCHLTHPEHAALVPVHLFGMVLSLWLERRGVLTLHASAAATAVGAVAVLASKGAGKTTLSAALVAGGGALLTDDLLALPFDGDAFVAQPAYPQLRMTLTQAEAFAGTAEGLGVVNPTTGKVGVPVDRFGTFSAAPAPLRAVYLPSRVDGGEAVSFETLTPRNAFLEVVRHTFLPREVADLGLQRDRFERLTRLASTVPFRRVSFPSGAEVLPRVVEAILADAG